MKGNDKMLTYYTGLQNKKTFERIINKIKDKTTMLPRKKLAHWKKLSNFSKKKSGRKPGLSSESCLLLTLFSLRVGLPEQDIVFRFGISRALVSKILVTWISFLARKLSCLIHRPNREDVKGIIPNAFRSIKL